jgi:hypothetical protein
MRRCPSYLYSGPRGPREWVWPVHRAKIFAGERYLQKVARESKVGKRSVGVPSRYASG